MNWRRENEQSTDRASALARVVFPTPGKSSMIRWPSERRQRTANSSVSSGAWMTRRRLAVILLGERHAAADASTSAASASTACSSIYPLPAEPRPRSRIATAHSSLLRLPTARSPVRREEDELVPVATRTRCQNEIRRCRRRGSRPCLSASSRARTRPASPSSAAKPTRIWPFRPPPAQLGQHVLGRLELDRPWLGVLRPLARDRFGRAVVGDRRGHDDHVGVAARRAPRARGRRPWAPARPRRRRAAARRGSRDERHLAPRAAAPRARARRPSSRRSGCRRSAPSRAARACPRR